MKNLKKNALLVSAAVIMMALSACGNGGGNSGGGKSSRRPTTSRPPVVSVSSEPKVFPMVNLKIDKGDGNPTTEEVMMGSRLTKPADPTAPAGKKFYGWKNVKNGGQIWDFDSDDLNVVMEDIELVPFFVDDLSVQTLEAELCPDITESLGNIDGQIGMDGMTYSGGQKGPGLIGRGYWDDQKGANEWNVSGNYYRDDDGKAHYATDADRNDPEKSCFGGFVHYNYVKNNVLTWNVNSDAAATNVTLLMRLSGEYGIDEEIQVFEGQGESRVSEWFDDTMFPVKVNGVALQYGKITIHNIVPKTFLDFQDYVVSAEVSLQAGANKIEMIVDNSVTLNGTIASSGPVIDCIKLYSSSNISWPTAKVSQLDMAEE